MVALLPKRVVAPGKVDPRIALPALKAMLPLVRNIPDGGLSVVEFIHILYLMIPFFTFTFPVKMIVKHLFPLLTLYRYKSRIVAEVGRPFIADVYCRVTKYMLEVMSPHQARSILFGRWVHKVVQSAHPDFWGSSKYIRRVDEEGVSGWWFGDPETERGSDEVVLYFVHGGGFVIDTGGTAQMFFIRLFKEMALKRGIKFSIFQLDYELAPEFEFPSQIIETLAGYHYLVNRVGIDPGKICVSGDSAGGSVISGFLLHLARPMKGVRVPKSFGETPGRPAGCMLVSPYIDLVSNRPSRTLNDEFDVIGTKSAHACAILYTGAVTPEIQPGPSWWPSIWFQSPYPDFGITVPHLIGTKAGEWFGADVEKDSSGQGQGGKGGDLVVKERSTSQEPVGWHGPEAAKLRKKAEDRLRDPYCNPGVCRDREWLKEAFPGMGRTLVVYGGKEIFRDDIENFCNVLKKSNVAIQTLRKPFGSHDWLLYEYAIPFLHVTNSKGPDRKLSWGVERVSDFLSDLVGGGSSANGRNGGAVVVGEGEKSKL